MNNKYIIIEIDDTNEIVYYIDNKNITHELLLFSQEKLFDSFEEAYNLLERKKGYHNNLIICPYNIINKEKYEKINSLEGEYEYVTSCIIKHKLKRLII